MDFDDFKETMGIVCIIIIATVIILVPSLYGVTKLGNKKETEQCRMMNENGHNTSVEMYSVIGFQEKKCYIMTGDGRYVPYDRYWSDR